MNAGQGVLRIGTHWSRAVNRANKSLYSRVVGRLNILSLLALFACEIHYTTDANSRHWRSFCQAAPVSLQNLFLFL